MAAADQTAERTAARQRMRERLAAADAYWTPERRAEANAAHDRRLAEAAQTDAA